MKPQLQWLIPSPLWDELAELVDKTAYRRPALLRFATDTFMEELQGLLATEPANLRGYVARPETWSEPAVGLAQSNPAFPAPAGQAVSAEGQKQAGKSPPPFKLFQPAHSRFYLAAASLVCRLPGLPDRRVRPEEGERVSFVLRRRVAAEKKEQAWVAGETVAGWMEANEWELLKGEERLPMFAFQYGSNGTRRRIFAGLIPAGRRQTYVAARELARAEPDQPTPAALEDGRKIELQQKVIGPWVDLVSWFKKLSPEEQRAGRSVAETSAFILIDFADYLRAHIPRVWKAIQEAARSSLTGPEAVLYDQLGMELRTAMGNAKKFEDALERATLEEGQEPSLPDGYPDFRLTDANLSPLIEPPEGESPKIQKLTEAALPASPEALASKKRLPAKDPANPRGDDWYIVRCVYERPQCGPNTPPVLSNPTEPFQLASFFDPDAPARSIQVDLPVDTTASALRKYDKNVAFMISDQLSRQMSRVKGLKELMDGDLAPPSGGGMICSFSIPIITICALILLMVMVQLLNIVFWWLPFFKICFPLPGLKAKG